LGLLAPVLRPWRSRLPQKLNLVNPEIALNLRWVFGDHELKATGDDVPRETLPLPSFSEPSFSLYLRAHPSLLVSASAPRL